MQFAKLGLQKSTVLENIFIILIITKLLTIAIFIYAMTASKTCSPTDLIVLLSFYIKKKYQYFFKQCTN